jgi:hypothetical protein
MTIREAAEFFGVTNLRRLKRSARELGCLGDVAGGDVIDVDGLMRRSVEQMNSRQANPGKPKPTSPGQKLGILSARHARAPELIAKKEKAIKVAEAAVSAAKNPYETRKAKTMLADLKNGLKRLQDNQAADKAELDRILHEESVA